MREIGGYLELDRYKLPMLHENGLALNTGRNCLRYLIETKEIKSILMPYYICDVVEDMCNKCNVNIRRYHVNTLFEPIIEDIGEDEWLYVVNYYGQLTPEYMIDLRDRFSNIIFDHAQAYYASPIRKADNIYSCRKFFGVPDGAFLYTDVDISEELEYDRSCDAMDYVLGRFEGIASDYYARYTEHENGMADLALKRMSKLTWNLLHGIDYDNCRIIRNSNYSALDSILKDDNAISPIIPDGPFMYPFMVENAAEIRKKLIERQVYVPVFWKNVLNDCNKGSSDYTLAADILPLPCDQRYSQDDMRYVADVVMDAL